VGRGWWWPCTQRCDVVCHGDGGDYSRQSGEGDGDGDGDGEGRWFVFAACATGAIKPDAVTFPRLTQHLRPRSRRPRFQLR